jgi:hypothetical protein
MRHSIDGHGVAIPIKVIFQSLSMAVDERNV